MSGNGSLNSNRLPRIVKGNSSVIANRRCAAQNQSRTVSGFFLEIARYLSNSLRSPPTHYQREDEPEHPGQEEQGGGNNACLGATDDDLADDVHLK
jgi:hypothetical protein